MKILALQTSPNEHGLTATMARATLAGAEELGADTDLVHLRQRDIKACLACEDGWGQCRRDGTCIIEDELQAIRESMHSADALVISTPVYFGEVSEVTKSFLDRLRRCEWGGDGKLSGTPVIAISAAGGTGGGVVSALAQLDRYLQVLGLTPVDLITVTQRSRPHKVDTAAAAGRTLAGAKG
ncbi:MAG: flavodoxin family protein [Armatimonadia bacterium]|nr:flavodoxin family protein [Armatimonadia bacterium]